MDNVNQITAECFNALRQLRELDGPIRRPRRSTSRLAGFVEAMREKAREQGMSQRDADDIAYAHRRAGRRDRAWASPSRCAATG